VLRLKDISIKRKLTLIIMAASTVALLLVASGFVTYELITYQKTMRQDLATLAEIIGNESASALDFNDADRATEVLGALAAKKHLRAAAVYKDGRRFAQYPADETTPGLFPDRPERNIARVEEDHLVLFHEIFVKGVPTGTLYLKSDLQGMRDRFQRYALIVLVITLASLGVIYLLSDPLQRIISQPIYQLAQTVKAVSAKKQYSVRAVKHGDDELGQLIDGFNEMLGQIQARDTALRQSNDQLELHVEERTRELRSEITERQRAEEALQRQFQRITLINQITQVISERQDTESILHVVLGQLEDHLGLDLGSVVLFDVGADTLNVAALRVRNPLLATKLDLREGTVLAMAQSGLGLCREGRTVYVPDTLKQPAALGERLVAAGLRSAVAVPLLVENRLFGVLLAARLRAEGFSSGDCEFLRMLSEHVALAAHQARLHSQLAHAYNELRQTQQTVMQQERLKALGQMASGIAHDVNNALSPVIGFTDLMLRGESGLTHTGRSYLKHIRTAGEDIAHIVARLREFYRRRDDTESLNQLNLNALAEQVIDMTRPRWRDLPQSRGCTIEMQTDFAPEVPDLIGIESEIREAFTNLVLNAVDALPKGGRITFRTKVTRSVPAAASDAEPQSQVVVEVSDTGIGMNEETCKRCLEPFFSTKGRRGTGLGLAMVYGVMERHEGKIEIDSAPGKGSTFRLIFPVRKAPSSSRRTEGDTAAIEPLRILYVDDEPLLRELLKEMLGRDGHEVEVSDGGQSGLDTFRSAFQRGAPFDLVITDLGMPYVDGRQVAKTLKQESPGTPVVMLTGWGAFMKEDGSPPTHVDGVLSKPPRSRELRETLRRLTPAAKASRRSSAPSQLVPA
jgi:signal transduction histidine kinase/ActR/RegA family two-component response regulator